MGKLVHKSLLNFMDVLAQAVPTPGGGSSAALVGAMGVALLEMSMGYSSFSKNRLKLMQGIRQSLMRRVDEDVRVYKKVVQSWEKGPAQKKKALVRATEVPKKIYKDCQKALRVAKQYNSHIKPALRSDWMSGQLFLKAAMTTTSLNIEQNLKTLDKLLK